MWHSEQNIINAQHLEGDEYNDENNFEQIPSPIPQIQILINRRCNNLCENHVRKRTWG